MAFISALSAACSYRLCLVTVRVHFRSGLKPFGKFAKQARKQQHSCLRAGLSRSCQSPGNVTGSKPWHQDVLEVCVAFRSGQSSPAEHSTLKALLPTEPKYSIMELHLQINPRTLPSLAVMDTGNT